MFGLSLSVKCKEQLAHMVSASNHIEYSGETSNLMELGYDLTRPLFGQIIGLGHIDDEPLKWITVSLSRHSATLISYDLPDLYDSFDEEEFDYLFSFTEREKEWIIDPFPWRKKKEIHYIDPLEADYYLTDSHGLSQEDSFGFRTLRLMNEVNRGLILHLDIQLTGMVSGLGEYNGQKMNWIVLDQTYRGMELLSERVLDEEFYFNGTIKDWKQSRAYRWLNTEFVEGAFSKEEVNCLVQYEKIYGFDFTKAWWDEFNGFPFYGDYYWSSPAVGGDCSDLENESVPGFCSLLSAEEVLTCFETPEQRIARRTDGTISQWYFIDKIDGTSYQADMRGARDWHLIDTQGEFYAASWDQGFGYYADFGWNLRPTVMLKVGAVQGVYPDEGV